MRLSYFVCLCAFACLTVSAAAWAAESAAGKEPAVPPDEAGFIPLFNGKDLAGWEGDAKLWVVEDGMLIGRSRGINYSDYLATTRTFEDFVLRLQIQLVDNKGNTGVLFRSKRVEDSHDVSGYQADFAPDKHGNLFDEARRKTILAAPEPEALAKALKPADWNDYEVRAEGSRITLSINGVKMVDYTEADASIPRQGVIAVQVHKGSPMEVRFRNIRIKEIAPAKQPTADLKSKIVRLGDTKPRVADWGEQRQSFSGKTYATEDVFVATIRLQPGKANHKSHRHAGEEYMILVEGSGTWSLDGKEVPAQHGDIVYAEPWVYHGFTNTGDKPAVYVVLRYKGKGVPPPAQPDGRPNELTSPVGQSAQ